jgi:hypothetical protein
MIQHPVGPLEIAKGKRPYVVLRPALLTERRGFVAYLGPAGAGVSTEILRQAVVFAAGPKIVYARPTGIGLVAQIRGVTRQLVETCMHAGIKIQRPSSLSQHLANVGDVVTELAMLATSIANAGRQPPWVAIDLDQLGPDAPAVARYVLMACQPLSGALGMPAGVLPPAAGPVAYVGPLPSPVFLIRSLLDRHQICEAKSLSDETLALLTTASSGLPALCLRLAGHARQLSQREGAKWLLPGAVHTAVRQAARRLRLALSPEELQHLRRGRITWTTELERGLFRKGLAIPPAPGGPAWGTVTHLTTLALELPDPAVVRP